MTAVPRSFRDTALEREATLDHGLKPKAADAAFRDLTTYLEQPLPDIARDYWTNRPGDDATAQQRVAEATDESVVNAYYESTPQYLYEAAYLEGSYDRQSWCEVVARACRKLGLSRVLDFGGGIGGLTLYLRLQGIRCDYVDVPGKTYDYAAWRFAQRHLPVEMFDARAPQTWPHEAYDAVTSCDVLEHVFSLDRTIESLTRLLRPGGLLLSKSTFAVADGHHIGIHLAKHAPYADVRVLNELLGRYGFQFLGQLKPNRLSRFLRVCGVLHAVAGIRISPRLKHGGNFLVHRMAVPRVSS